MYYVIYRDGDSIYFQPAPDTQYVDIQGIEGDMTYSYNITCRNDVGESGFSNTIMIQSWPSEDNVSQDKILKIYPNPIRKKHDSHILYALGENYCQ